MRAPGIKTRSPRVATVAIAVLACACACGNPAASPTTTVGTAASSGTLHFAEAAAPRVNPSSRVTLTLLGDASAGPVTVWLEGDYLDASLDRGLVDLGDAGSAELSLVAPSAKAAFDVRARQGADAARVTISVRPEGTAMVRVTPQYDGVRPAPSFVAGAFVGKTCAELTSGALPDDDGSPRAEAPPGATLILNGVPAGEPLAILARVLHYAAGCVDLPALDVDAVRDVTLPVYRRDVDLSGAFDAAFRFEPSADELALWRAGATPLSSAWVDAFEPPGSDDGVWLLDAMQRAVGANANARDAGDASASFAANRAQNGWNALATSWLSARAPSPHARAATLLDQGLASPPTPLGLVVRPGAAAGDGLVTPVSLGGRALVGAWVAAPVAFHFSADAADVLRLEGVVTLRPGSLALFGGDLAAAPSYDFASALATSLDCAGLSRALVDTTPSGESANGCDAACTADACRAAFAARAHDAAAAIDDARAAVSLALVASAKPDLGDRAEVQRFAGAWSGTITMAAGTAPFGVHGAVSGGPRP